MASQAHLIIDGRNDFNVMESYYRMFSHEMSTKPYYTYNTLTPTRIPSMTFEKLIDQMNSMISGAPGIDNFVIVCHGLYDHTNNDAKGIAMPITDKTNLKAAAEVLDHLLDFMDKGTSESDMDGWESNFSYTNASIGVSNEKFPAGSVKRIVGKMKALRQLKVRCVEFRACNLGTVTTVMETIGRCFGARFIVAPDRRMFFVSVAPTANTPKQFDAFLKTPALHNARVFQNPANPSQKLAIQVAQGTGTSRNVNTTANVIPLKWFTDKFLWPGSTYADGTRAPKEFFLEGMDLPGSTMRFAVPQDQEYRDHLVEVGPLKGNMI